MTRLFIALLIVTASSPVVASFIGVFRLEDGHTNWQYVANTTATILIAALTYTLVRLFMVFREARRYNQELEEIRSELEERVKERTATLDESNRLLQESHKVLEGEVVQHQNTAKALLQSESYIHSILRSMPLMLIGLDANGAVSQWNWRAEEVSGLKIADVMGRNLWRAYPSITVSPEQVKQAMEEDRTLTIKQSQRGRYHFDVTIYPLNEQTGLGVVILIDDVTQRVSTENLLIQRDKMSSMGELAGSLAQDISTPVHAMLMDIEEVKSRVSGQSYEAHRDPSPMLDDALLRGEQVSAVISNLLAFSSGRPGDMKSADITEIIDHSLELAESVITTPTGIVFRDITISRSYEADLPHIPCHATELQQVFLSLFRHCATAMGEVDRAGYSPEISIEANKFYDALWLKVQHNGKGITLAEQQVLFEPFFTDTTGASDANYETSLRLSYPYFIVTEQHRGQLAVTSDIDIGTTFHIQLLLR
ncbi:MAG: PAS domain S-box-containing protein [Halioglobus sp.]|jgi:PAS domain S-box-containing protein